MTDMRMNEFRRLATKIDQHMKQLATQGVSEAHSIINHMMGYVPDNRAAGPGRGSAHTILQGIEASSSKL
ncbi:hypothetical protein CFBP6109_P100068 (plasmid) [Pseudomonas syringae pv. cerasicola]|uniref:Uncharacterized protein n=7 Tax=Pseudomonas syringae group TaxID=136849 RepID=A0A330K2S4_PSESX|nr:hypothetical protein CFBP6109_P100068 [Pseudomonas syringae pv. cerasicola]SPD89295.1 hypothetical protein PSCFBP6110_P100020 [Pseudomonas syringae pv. cerasicola]